MATIQEQNKALVLQMYEEIWNKGNLGFVNTALSANFKDYPAKRATELPVRGREFVIETATNLRNAMPDFRNQVIRIVADEDRVVYLGRLTGTQTANYLQFPPSGNKVDVTEITEFRLENGKIVERWSLFNLMALLQQIGAIPAGPGGH